MNTIPGFQIYAVRRKEYEQRESLLCIVAVAGSALESSVKQWLTPTSPYLGDTYVECEWGPPPQAPSRGAPDCKLAVKSCCSLWWVSCKQPSREGHTGPTGSSSIRQLTTVDRIMRGMPHYDVTSTETPPASTHARTPRRLALPLREWWKRNVFWSMHMLLLLEFNCQSSCNSELPRWLRCTRRTEPRWKNDCHLWCHGLHCIAVRCRGHP